MFFMKDEQRFDQIFENYILMGTKNPVKTFLMLIKGRKKKLGLAIIVYILKNTPIWILPILLSNIVNILTQPEKYNLNDIWFNLGVMVFSLILNIPLHQLYVKLVSSSMRSMEAGIRATLIRKFQILSIQFYKEFRTGKIQSKLLRDVEQIQNLANNIMSMVIPAVIDIIIALALALSKNWMIAVFYILVAPLAGVSMFMFRKEIRQKNEDFRKEIENMSARIYEMVEMIPLTRAHGLEDEEISKMDYTVARVEKRGHSLDLSVAIFSSLSFVIVYVFQILCLLFSGYLAYTKVIQIGDIVLFQTFFGSIVARISGLLFTYPQFASGSESLVSVSEILASDDVEINSGKRKLKRLKGKFDFIDFKYRYPDAVEDDYVFDGLTLTVEAGESVAFVGKSGAGKSTLLNIIIGYDKPTSGQLLIDGVDITDVDLKEYRQNIAVVPQNNILFSGTIRENITYGLSDISDQELDKVMEMANIKEFIEKLPDGIETNVGEHGNKISGGQRQRIAIARALIRDPQVIIFDEATSALDTISEAKVQQAVDSMMKDRTTFIVAHRLSTVRKANKIVVVEKGKCVEIGSYEELMAKKGHFYEFNKFQDVEIS